MILPRRVPAMEEIVVITGSPKARFSLKQIGFPVAYLLDRNLSALEELDVPVTVY
jgi:hypothetical protein